ncbi:trans-1,2-dihydrobenzene-1,2-diol dehydrogenase-like [Thrips palmi]|uniref:Trans-1,2-dihydrobenzene-1,2-diol dehydrogenase n=1 Tax=Thrips palmi TaxID=161013 RepID=A0A6P9AFG5_THRPL|nr:trans-1,2-dihydrobenzene-1,2-diol dehydrogenase-like [Thrips palmi]
MALRWGVACAGQICHDFLTAMGTLPAGDHQVVAVAARDMQRAKDFAALHKIPVAYASYEELAANKDVEIVYIGSVCTNHYEMATMFLQHGKHVLCEKPLTLSSRDTIALVELAKSKRRFFMEAVWSRFFPAYEYIREQLASGAIGDIVQVNANMTIHFPEGSRVRTKSQGGGTVLDFGVYVLQLVLMVFGPRMPLEVRAVGHVNNTGCDDATAVVLKYPGNRTAMVGTSALADMNNDAVIWGTKGFIKIVDPFWCPTKVVSGNETKEFPLPPGAHPYFNRNSSGLRFEADEVKRCIRQGLLECPKMMHEESITIAKIQDEIRKQIGVSIK